MKVLAILCIAGLAFASRSSIGESEWYFQSGKEYVYEYSGRLLTGIPQLADVYSGVGINCTVHIEKSRENTFSLSVKSPKYTRVNEKLESLSQREPSNWRQLRLPELSEVSEEFKSILERPIMFTMTNGEIRTPKVYKDEPVWSVNFKKALALQFQTKMDMSTAGWEQQQQQSEESDDSITYWKVKEETIDGVCENIYEVRELPKYMIVDRPEMIPYPEACPEERYYGLTKTKDVAKCEKRSSFTYFAPGHYGYQLTGNNMDMWSRSSNTRYIGCGSRGRLIIQTIINDGELNQNLLGYNSERFVTGTLQMFRLKEIRDASPVQDQDNYVPLHSMMFEHAKETLHHQKNLQKSNLNQEERIKLIQSGRIPEEMVNNPEILRQAMPRNFLYGVNDDDVTSDKIMPQLKKYISEIVRELTAGVDTREKQITSKVMAVSRGFLLLRSKEEIRTVYEELKSEFSSSSEDLHSLKNVFFDTLLMSGCPKCIKFIKESIISGEISKFQTASFFIWMPNYVKLPTEELLMSLYELVTSEKITKDKDLYNKAIMGYSTLLNRACISPYRKTMYPIHVFGEFCNPDSEIIVSKWIPFLTHDLKYSHSAEKRNEIIVSLGLMQHKSVIGELLPFVEGSVEETSKLNRFLAIHSLSNVAASMDPTHVVPVFFSILSNPSECTTLRIAAFNSLMRQNPSMTVMHKIASLTWTIKDQELLKVINMAFFTLSQESEELPSGETTLTLSKKAFLVYPLIKKTYGVLPTSTSIFRSERLRELGIGYDSKFSWTASKTSFLPQDFYVELNYFLSQFKFTPLSFGFHLTGAENVYHQIEKLFKPIYQQQQQQQQQEQQDQYDEDQQQGQQPISQEWESILEQLKVKARESGPMDGALFLRWFESAPIFYNFDKMSIDKIREKIAPFLANPHQLKNKLCGTFPVNYQVTTDRTPNVFMIPSDMGFPIVMEVLMPVAYSLRGSLEIKCDSEVPAITLKGTLVANSQYSGWVGTSIPFTKEYTVTGVQEQFVLNLPATIELKADIPNGQLSYSIRPHNEIMTRPTELFVYDVRPFVTYKKVSDLTPLTLTSNMKVIRSNQETKTFKFPYGEYIGLNLLYKIETESPYTDVRSALDIMKMYNNNPINALRFIWTHPALRENGKPSIRRHVHSVTLDPSSSTTKEFQFDIKLGFGKKVKGQQQIKYKTIKLKNNNQQQQQEQQQQLNKLNPFQIVDHNNEEQSVHPRRQQKIQQSLQKLNVESGYGLSIIYTFTMKGSRPRSFTHSFTYSAGQESHSSSHGMVKTKWDMHYESETSTPSPVKQLCIKGEVDMPVLPLWNIEELRSSLIDFRFINDISFGKSSCSESSIKAVGNAKVSHEQKEYSRQSQDARKCHELLENRVPGAKLSDACQRTRLQAETVDEVEYKLEYNNVPREVLFVEKKVVEYLKIFLWPYIKAVKSSSSSNRLNQNMLQDERSSFPVMVRVLFHRETPSFDLIINKPEESIVFSKIRIPYPLNLVFPVKAGTCPNNFYQILKSLSGESWTPECKVGTEMLTTFDNKTMPLKMDDCFHLLSGDCSKHRSYGILARSMKHDQNKREVKVFLGKNTLLFTPTEQRSENPEIKVTVNRDELEVPSNTWRPIKAHGQQIASIFRSIDNVFELKSPQYRVQFRFDGSRIVVYASQLLKSKLCGLCGNFNQVSKDDMTGPSKCIHAKPEVQVASYRVQSHHCERLPSHIERELEEDKQKCVQFKEIPTQVIKSLKAQAGQCTVRKHIVVEKPGQVCISKNQVTECHTACKVADGKMASKSVEFTCFNQGRIAEHYVQKANNGQELPELRNLETSFESKVEQPKKCVSAILKN